MRKSKVVNFTLVNTILLKRLQYTNRKPAIKLFF